MKKLIYTSVAVLGLFLVTSGTSEAGGIRFSFGGGHHHGHHGHHGFHRGPVYNGWYGGHGHHGVHRYPRWHDTSHYDYHPGGWQRHYDHYDYVPGHYHWHRDGHWHY